MFDFITRQTEWYNQQANRARQINREKNILLNKFLFTLKLKDNFTGSLKEVATAIKKLSQIGFSASIFSNPFS